MLTKQEEIAQIEQDAKDLVSSLKALHEEVGSYQAAKEKLDEIGVSLASLIDKTQALAQESHGIIQSINEIGSGQIFEQLESLKKETADNLSALLKNIETLAEESHKIAQDIAGIQRDKILEQLEALGEKNENALSLIGDNNKSLTEGYSAIIQAIEKTKDSISNGLSESNESLVKGHKAIVQAIEDVKGSIFSRLGALESKARLRFLIVISAISVVVLLQVLILIVK